MSDQVALLFTNEAFYAAFASRDIDAMNAVWSHRAEITCIHPGWLPLAGREAVMRSWHAILANPESPAISCWNATGHIYSDMEYVLCHEKVENNFLAATNVFIREDSSWKLVHHQAGASPPPALLPADPPPAMQ